jgi:hypothetical protein
MKDSNLFYPIEIKCTSKVKNDKYSISSMLQHRCLMSTEFYMFNAT